MADATKASVLVVWVASAWVRILQVAPTKIDVGVTPHRRWPNSPTGREWKTSKMIAEPHLYKNKNKNKKLRNNSGVPHLYVLEVKCMFFMREDKGIIRAGR